MNILHVHMYCWERKTSVVRHIKQQQQEQPVQHLRLQHNWQPTPNVVFPPCAICEHLQTVYMYRTSVECRNQTTTNNHTSIQCRKWNNWSQRHASNTKNNQSNTWDHNTIEINIKRPVYTKCTMCKHLLSVANNRRMPQHQIKQQQRTTNVQFEK